MSEGTLRVEIEPLEAGGFVASAADVPGLRASGRTMREATEILLDLARLWIEDCLELGDPVPPALQEFAIVGT